MRTQWRVRNEHMGGRIKNECATIPALVPYCACTVSFVERGQRHSARVDAESAHEACVLALKQFASSRYIKGPGRHAALDIEIDAPRHLTLKVNDVIEWLYNKPGKTPEERDKKKRLKDLLADDRH